MACATANVMVPTTELWDRPERNAIAEQALRFDLFGLIGLFGFDWFYLLENAMQKNLWKTARASRCFSRDVMTA
jgi:hypothetical protein